ncbi:LLM class flavin-dependent oxidoreductase [Aureimonas sp. ME7]|uniref:LLM class flavin-dependent oxidoreductase n=1 Tax=Aureimonas sp. ME7 TaxID=2744252 RepID=UPI0015F52DFC|nr:LLM class flavin-dependent oxidoreductase [Aureimonas sp. ME7]
MTRQLHLAGFLWASHLTHSHAQWRHPRQDPDFLSADYYVNLARIAEKGKFDFVFFADILALPERYGGDISEGLRRGVQAVASLDPAHVVAIMAAATTHLGLGLTRSTTYYPPYDIARTFATLDHLSKGRVAWNVVTSLSQAEARNFGFENHLDHNLRYERAEEFLEAAFKLWGSWDEGALVRDKQAGIFADPTKVRAIHHEGAFFRTKGPLNVPRSPQGRPAIMQAGSSSRGKDFAARWAEIIFEIDPTPEGRRAYYADVKRRAVAFGRDPDTIKIFPSLIPFIGETETIAREKKRFHDELADPVSGLITLSAHTDHDFSQYSLDEPIADLEVPGCQGMFDVAKRLTDKESLRLRDIGRLYAQGVLLPHVVGTPAQVADAIEEGFHGGEADGYIVSSGFSPGGYEEFVEFVVPELQRRGLFRREYEGRTLRDHLGLAPATLEPLGRLPEAAE